MTAILENDECCEQLDTCEYANGIVANQSVCCRCERALEPIKWCSPCFEAWL